MKLTDLHPRYIRVSFEDIEGMPRQRFESVANLAEAHGIQFHCPCCVDTAKMPHWVTLLSASAGAPRDAFPEARWRLRGSDCSELTLAPEPLTPNKFEFTSTCGFYGTIIAGEVVDMNHLT